MKPENATRLGAAALIDLADRASVLSPGQWSLALLQRAYPDTAHDALLALPVGASNRLMLAIRAQLRAGPLRAEPICKACGETYELTLDPADVGLGGGELWPDAGYRTVTICGTDVTLRAVALGDILAVENVIAPDQAAKMLAARVQDAANELPLDALGEALEALDPGADVWLETACPECHEKQLVAFDAVHFVASELQQMSRKILCDVVDIARVFHWSEADILALPEHRRAFYVAEALA